MPTSSRGRALREAYAEQSEKIRKGFETMGDGRAAIVARAALVDGILRQLYPQHFGSKKHQPENLAVLAVGGYGRRMLFPHSDVDLLFLCANEVVEQAHRDAIRSTCQTLWDLGLRVSPTTRTLVECEEFSSSNPEFSISLLDCRFLAGRSELFARLRDEVLPGFVLRERRDLVRSLQEITRERHQKHGDTIFHLEPNLKEAPGGLRDYHVACWLALIDELEDEQGWLTPEGLAPAALGEAIESAHDFLAAVRCFLHYRQGRDDNVLTYELQGEAAARCTGAPSGHALPAGEWMRQYFRHTRAIERTTARLLDEVLPARSMLYELFEDWRSRISSADFITIRGRVFLRRPAGLLETGALLRLFEFVARHGIALSGETEQHVREALERPGRLTLPEGMLWESLREIFSQPHAGAALRAMHDFGLLGRLFPEFCAIDSLVVRDFYHRYTVDEHSFRTLERLDHLGETEDAAERKFAEILSELERPDLLFLSLLFHDVGKGMPVENHIEGSLAAAKTILERLGLEPEERATVEFLIRQHLAMSATLLRRDIFAPETVEAFADVVETPERLKMLCLFTYADIRSVNPEALTPWKAEMLWQLYAATANQLARSLDQHRVHPASSPAVPWEDILPRISKGAGREELAAFLEGLPRRYLAMHSAKEIASHFELARGLAHEAVRLQLRRGPHSFALTLLAKDQPRLFVTIAGALTGWGMNIVKAEAFANAGGIVLDTFQFVDLHRTLELNPSEVERFEKSVVELVAGKGDLQALLQGRMQPLAVPAKVPVETIVRLDDSCSMHSTLLELITQDRPGLLYHACLVMAELGCNIEVALIDTEAQKAIDVFYLTRKGKKLPSELQDRLRQALLALDSGASQ